MKYSTRRLYSVYENVFIVKVPQTDRVDRAFVLRGVIKESNVIRYFLRLLFCKMFLCITFIKYLLFNAACCFTIWLLEMPKIRLSLTIH